MYTLLIITVINLNTKNNLMKSPYWWHLNSIKIYEFLGFVSKRKNQTDSIGIWYSY